MADRTEKYYVDYDEVDQKWCVFQMDAGEEHKQMFDVCVCSCEIKQEATLIRDALESFPYTVMDYLEYNFPAGKKDT